MKRRDAKAKAGRGRPDKVTRAATSPSPGTPRPLARGKEWLFRLLAVVVVPLMVLGALEVGLRLGGYGYPTGLFKKARIGGEDFWVQNDQFSLRFFPPELSRTPDALRFPVHKAAGTCRIFIMGESAAMGDPEPAYGASRYLEALLRERFPGTKFEVINVAFTAINSHVILPIARDCAQREGDLWIIYMGNNEMVGPFGAATVFGAQAPPATIVRLSLAAQTTRIGQLVMALSRRLGGHAGKATSWAGMEMFMENKVAPGDPCKEAVYRNFARNLQDIVRTGLNSGARVLLNSMAVNLKDCAPFVSESNSNLPAADRAQFEELWAEGKAEASRGGLAAAAEEFAEAAKLDPHFAELQYRWGDCLLRLSNAPTARPHFQAACDDDALPFRADSRINAALRETAQTLGARGLVFVDAAAALDKASPAGIAGQESFYEHVHFNFDGNYRLARLWADEVARLLQVSAANKALAAWATQPVCEERLGLTDWGRCKVLDGIIRRLQKAPLSARFGNAEGREVIEKQVAELRQRTDATAGTRIRETFLEAINHSREDSYLRESFADWLVSKGEFEQALVQWQKVSELFPYHYVACSRLGGLYAQLGRWGDAEAKLLQASALRPFFNEPWLELGEARAAQGKLESALKAYYRARQLRPQDPDCYYYIGQALLQLNRRAGAVENFRRAVQFNPDYWEAHDALGGQLGLEGNIPAAKVEFEQVVRLKPDYARGHLNLGVALMQQGQTDAGAREFQETLRLEPGNSVALDYLRQAQEKKPSVRIP